MSASFAGGLAAAVAAAVLYGGAPVAQATVARRAPAARGLGLAFLVQLLRRPVWLFALVGEIGGFLAEAYAFSAAPTTLVAPVASCDMLVFVVTGSIIFRRRPTGVGVLGVVSTIVGVVTLAVSLEHNGPGRPASTTVLIGMGVACVAAVGVAVVIGQATLTGGHPVRRATTPRGPAAVSRPAAVSGPAAVSRPTAAAPRPTAAARRAATAAAAFSAGAGIAYGVATLATRQIGRTFRSSAVWHLLTTPAPYVLVVCSLLGIALLQRGLQTAPLLAFPIVSGLSAFLPVVVGVGVLGDHVPSGGRRALLIAALILISAGLVLMTRDRMTAEPTAAE